MRKIVENLLENSHKKKWKTLKKQHKFYKNKQKFPFAPHFNIVDKNSYFNYIKFSKKEKGNLRQPIN